MERFLLWLQGFIKFSDKAVAATVIKSVTFNGKLVCIIDILVSETQVSDGYDGQNASCYFLRKSNFPDRQPKRNDDTISIIIKN